MRKQLVRQEGGGSPKRPDAVCTKPPKGRAKKLIFMESKGKECPRGAPGTASKVYEAKQVEKEMSYPYAAAIPHCG